MVTTKDCNENLDTLVECEKDCNGRMNCTNKGIQTGIWKKVERRVTQGRDNGLFAMEDLKKVILSSSMWEKQSIKNKTTNQNEDC